MVRTFGRNSALLGGLFLMLGATSARAQFNPHGRQKKPPAGSIQPRAPVTPRSPRTSAAPAATRPTAPAPNSAPQPSDDAVARLALIARYRALVLEKPGEPLPLQRLTELSLQATGSLDALVREFTEMASAPGPRRYAATLALAALLEHSGQVAEAALAYARASELEPIRPEAYREAGRLALSRGDREAAEKEWARALPLTRGMDRDFVLRALRSSSLDRDDLVDARQYQEQLAQAGSGQIHVAAELGRELLARGKASEAASELERVVGKNRGDVRALPPLLRDLGRAELASGQLDRATLTLARAARLAAGQPGLQREIDMARAEVARKRGLLTEFVKNLASEATTGPRLRLVGQLHEELGNTDEAVSSYRRALAKSSNDVDSRLDLVRLLEVGGQLEAAELEYRTLVRNAPSDLPLTFRYMEALLARGRREQALAEFDRVEPSVSDVDSRLLLIDFAERIEEPARASRLLARLDQAALSDPRHLVELGGRYYREGKSDKAREIWKRLATLAAHRPTAERARLLVLYGEVLLDHEETQAGLAALEQAAQLAADDPKVQRSLALGLERAASQDSGPGRARSSGRALALWLAFLAKTGGSELERIEARRHVVRLWQQSDRLALELPTLRKRLAATPPDLEAGRLLVEAESKLGLNRQAEDSLGRILRVVPGDKQSLETLMALLESTGRGAAALDVGERLVVVDPNHARAHLAHAMRLASKLRLDERALGYAERNVALGPQDASAQAELAELYRLQGKYQQARAALERALSLEPAMEPALLALAELCVLAGDEARASALLLRLVARSTDEARIGRAVQKALALAAADGRTGAGPLTELDELLLRLSIQRPTRPLYRSLLLEVYDAERQALERVLVSDSTDARELAKLDLARLGRRALTPLLAILMGPRLEEHRVALSLLAWAPSAASSQALIGYAKSAAPEALRVRALLGVSHVDRPETLQALESLLDGQSAWGGRVVQAAARLLAQQNLELARPALSKALDSRDPVVQSYALLGLAELGDERTRARSDEKLRRRVEAILADETRGAVTRAAAALCLGSLSGSSSSLQASTGDTEPLVAAAALRGWARLDSPDRTAALSQALVRGLVDGERDTRRAAATSAALFFGTPADKKVASSPVASRGREPSLDPRVDVENWLFVELPARARLHALVALEASYIEFGRLVLETSDRGTRSLLERLGSGGDHPTLSPLDDALGEVEPELATIARATVVRVHAALTPEITALATSADAQTRALALGLLVTPGHAFPGDDATWRAALFGDAEGPRVAAIERLGQAASVAATTLLAELSQKSPDWGTRRKVALALGEALQNAQTPDQLLAIDAALERLTHDSSGMVARAAQQARAGAPAARR